MIHNIIIKKKKYMKPAIEVVRVDSEELAVISYWVHGKDQEAEGEWGAKANYGFADNPWEEVEDRWLDDFEYEL